MRPQGAQRKVREHGPEQCHRKREAGAVPWGAEGWASLRAKGFE